MTEVDRLFDPEVVECPQAYYAELRDHDPVHHVTGTDAFIVSRPDLIKEVVADLERFSSTTSEFLFRDEHDHVGLRPPVRSAGHDEHTPAVLATADDPTDHV